MICGDSDELCEPGQWQHCEAEKMSSEAQKHCSVHLLSLLS